MDPATAMPQTVAQPELWYTLVKTLGMLSIVIGFLIVVLFLMKRFSIYGGNHPDRNVIKMVASYNLAPREKVVLLNVQGEHILVGVTTQNINYIATIKGNDFQEEPGEHLPGTEKVFSKYLSGAIKKVVAGDHREKK